MQNALSGVFATEPSPLSFAPAVGLRAFLLQREAGNLLIYSAASLADEAAAIEELGGLERHYLGHWHEAKFGHVEMAARFDAPLFCHESDRGPIAEVRPVEETFSERHRLGDDFEVIPIPGHTPGSTAFLWDSGRHRCLFTSDSLYVRDGEWVAALLGSSDRETYIASLGLLRDVEFDVLLPWTSRGASHVMTGKADARRRIDLIIDRLRRGEDH